MDGGQMLAALIGEKRRKYVHLVGVLCAVSFGLIGYLVFGFWFYIATYFYGFFCLAELGGLSSYC